MMSHLINNTRGGRRRRHRITTSHRPIRRTNVRRQPTMASETNRIAEVLFSSASFASVPPTTYIRPTHVPRPSPLVQYVTAPSASVRPAITTGVSIQLPALSPPPTLIIREIADKTSPDHDVGHQQRQPEKVHRRQINPTSPLRNPRHLH
jgi:hypothetical protein